MARARYVAVVDLTNKSVTVIDGNGHIQAVVAPGVTRSNASEKLRRHGWRLDEKWKLTSPPDGFSCGAFPR